MGYTMTTDEQAYWQDQAALLDPAAYVWVKGSAQSITVATDERYYLINAWRCEPFDDGAGEFFHRPADIGQALIMPEGFTLTTVANANAFFYYCRPSLVTGADARYASDPRGLYFERLLRLGELTRYQLGTTATSTTMEVASFPSDFTDGLAVHVEASNVAWLIMLVLDESTGMNTLNEISDADPVRFAETCIFPFKRTTHPKIGVRGVSIADGVGNLDYVKLPGDW